ncbi:ABC transporter substrate-binding protein [uncultured Paracoccus sp.]|uniref:ABC transporter substrate-binding protein n=1 Tax=uncultured Paracoccus sp. TaxID=189685 RepID=UPI00260E8A69|nr:ABC transporter substrate-binding protein [uncultured Paracoccus sp.]
MTPTTMISRRKLLITTAMATPVMVLGVPLLAQEPQRGGTLVQLVEDTPRHFNPAVQSGIATGEPGTQIFASLLRFDEGFEPQPYLAESWEMSQDGLKVTVTLVENATFHDGEPITSEDVAFSIETVKKYHPFTAMFAPVDSVDTPDARTAVINLGRPHPAIYLAMSSQLLSIIPKHIYGDGQDIPSHPRNTENVVGSGPFRLTEFNRGQNYILERYENFFIKERPYLDRIVTRIIEDSSARAIAMENGEAQLTAFESNPRDIKRMEANPNLEVTSEGYAGIGPLVWLAFNTKKAPLDDKRVRQAIACAVDRDFIVNALLLGTAAPTLNGIHPGSPFYNPDVDPYALDLDRANALLDEAGHAPDANGTRFSLVIDYGSEPTKPMAEYIRPALKKIGIDVSVRSAPDFATWAQRISNYDFDMTWDTVFNWGDPVIGVNRTYQSSNIRPGVIWSNTQQYESQKVDEIIAAANVENDPEKRKQLYFDMQEILNDDLPLYPVYTVPYHTINSTRVGNPPRGIWATCAPLDRVFLKS